MPKFSREEASHSLKAIKEKASSLKHFLKEKVKNFETEPFWNKAAFNRFLLLFKDMLIAYLDLEHPELVFDEELETLSTIPKQDIKKEARKRERSFITLVLLFMILFTFVGDIRAKGELPRWMVELTMDQIVPHFDPLCQVTLYSSHHDLENGNYGEALEKIAVSFQGEQACSEYLGLETAENNLLLKSLGQTVEAGESFQAGKFFDRYSTGDEFRYVVRDIPTKSGHIEVQKMENLIFGRPAKSEHEDAFRIKFIDPEEAKLVLKGDIKTISEILPDLYEKSNLAYLGMAFDEGMKLNGEETAHFREVINFEGTVWLTIDQRGQSQLVYGPNPEVLMEVDTAIRLLWPWDIANYDFKEVVEHGLPGYDSGQFLKYIEYHGGEEKIMEERKEMIDNKLRAIGQRRDGKLILLEIPINFIYYPELQQILADELISLGINPKVGFLDPVIQSGYQSIVANKGLISTISDEESVPSILLVY
ncbi:MAG: hypothetical protein PVJ09_01105 [Candidatus Woesebacteria bacterium]